MIRFVQNIVGKSRQYGVFEFILGSMELDFGVFENILHDMKGLYIFIVNFLNQFS